MSSYSVSPDLIEYQGLIGYQEGQSPENNVMAFIERHVQASPNKTAFQWLTTDTKSAWLENPNSPLAHETLSFKTLWQQVDAVAGGLKALGIQKGDRVLIFIPMSPSLYITLFATQKIGAIAVFLDSWARADQLGLCADQATPKAFIAPEVAFKATATVEQLKNIPHHIVVGSSENNYSTSLELLINSGLNAPIEAVEKEDTALITFTTGSSGPPKGANRTHRFLAAQHYALDKCLPYQSNDIDLPVFPIFSLNNMAAGVETVIPAIDLARPADTDGDLLIAQLQQSNATCCTLSPSLLRAVSKACRMQRITIPSLMRAATGGAPISSDDAQAFKVAAPNASLHILYGSTEVEPIAHLIAEDMPSENSEEGVCVGTLAEGLSYKLLKLHKGPIHLHSENWQNLEVTTGEVGELIVSGEHVCRDYYNNPDAFEGSKILDNEGIVWHRTGDLCRLDNQNRLWVVGRLHNVIIRNKQALFPVKPEVVMKRLPFVQAAAYLGLPDPHLGEKAVAAFSIQQNQKEWLDSTHCIEIVQNALKDAKIIVDEIFLVENIPLDPRHHSKVEYQRLREQLLSQNS